MANLFKCNMPTAVLLVWLGLHSYRACRTGLGLPDFAKQSILGRSMDIMAELSFRGTVETTSWKVRYKGVSSTLGGFFSMHQQSSFLLFERLHKISCSQFCGELSQGLIPGPARAGISIESCYNPCNGLYALVSICVHVFPASYHKHDCCFFQAFLCLRLAQTHFI